jgi:hypothetical protein
MNAVALMVGLSAGTLLSAVAVFGSGVELLLGMAAPLAMAVGSWIAVERTYERDPGSVTAVMIGGFAVKMVFFGAYVIIALGGLHVRPAPFVASFTAYFVGLYALEALYLKRLFAGPK